MKTAVIDIGGTALKAGCFDGKTITNRREYATNASLGAQNVIKEVIGILEQYPEKERIGISTTGQIDSKEGKVVFAGQNIPGYEGLEIRKILWEQFHIPVVVENDVNAAAIGEAHFGAGRGCEDFLCLTYGTGIGGAVVLHKELYRGCSYAAGEFGGILVHPEERRQDDLFSGCYERYASVSALVKKAMQIDSALQSGRDIFNRKGDQKLEQVIDDWIYEIALGLVTLVHCFNPSCILLGGGVMSQKSLLPKIREKVSHMVMPCYHDVKISTAELGNDAGMYGAAYLSQIIK